MPYNAAIEQRLDDPGTLNSTRLATRLLLKLPSTPFPLDRPASGGRLAGRIAAAIVGGLLFALALAIAFAIHRMLGVQNVLLVFLPAALLAAVWYGFWTASWVSVLSVAATSYFFAAPRFSFAVSDPENVGALVVFLIASGLASSVAAQARQRAEQVVRHNRILEQLHVATSRLAGISRRTELFEEIVRQAETLLEADVKLLQTPESTGTDEPAVARSADRFADPGRGWLYRPIRVARLEVAVLGICPRSPEAKKTLAATRLVDLLVEQIEVNLERIRLAEEKRRSEMLAETEKLRSALLTSISHDLRTPLSSILGNVTSVRLYGHLHDEATRLEMLEQAELETLRLSRFVDNLLQMTRIEAGALAPTLEPIDLSDVIGSALKRQEKALSGHTVRVRIEEPVPMLMLDFVLTEQVIANLVDNAAKYSPPGSLIEIDVAVSTDSVLLGVRDEGPGIALQDTERVFERFFRAEVPDRRPAGTGLGLAICKGFVEAMGGTIGISNRPGARGTEVVVRFPSGPSARKAA